MKRSRLIFIFKLSIAAGLLWLLFRFGQIEPGAIARAFRRGGVLIACGFLATLAAGACTIVRFWILGNIQKLEIGFFQAVRYTMIGYFFNTFMPGGSGGDIVRAGYVISDRRGRMTRALTIAFADRGIGLHALLLLNLMALLTAPMISEELRAVQEWRPMVVLLLLGSLAPMLVFWPPAGAGIARPLGCFVGGAAAWEEAFQLYRANPGALTLAYFFSVLSAVFNVLLIHCMVLSVAGAGVRLIESLALGPLVILANTVPITPGGVGVAESAAAGLYLMAGHEGGASGMLLCRLAIIAFSLLGLPFFLYNRKEARDR